MTFDTCRASAMAVGSDPRTPAAAKTFLAARALIALGLAGMVGPCGCWRHAATPVVETSGGSHISSPRPKYRSHPEVANLIKKNNASQDANNTIDQLVRILAVLNSELTPPGAVPSLGSALDGRNPADSPRCGHRRP